MQCFVLFAVMFGKVRQNHKKKPFLTILVEAESLIVHWQDSKSRTMNLELDGKLSITKDPEMSG